MSTRIGELFAGYGGLGMGAQAVFGGHLAWYSEIDRGALKILEHRFPDVPNLGDITTIDWSQVEPVDILTGGFPCQDVSAAGRRAGLRQGTRSGLWHEMARAIDALRPPLVVIENVRGLLSARGDTSEEYEAADLKVRLTNQLRDWLDLRRGRALNEGRTTDAQRLATRTHRLLGLHRRAVAERKRAERRIVRAIGTVLGTLADLGYDAVWHGLRAADVGAPHGRFRVFIVAHPASHPGRLTHRNGGSTAVTQRRGLDGWADELRGSPVDASGDREGSLLPTPTSSDTNGPGHHGAGGVDLRTAIAMFPTPRATDGTKGGPGQRGSSGDLMLPSAVAMLPTPQARDWKGYGEADGNRHDPNLSAIPLLLPTPSGAAGGQTSRSGDRIGEPLLGGIARLLPTPRTENNENRQSDAFGGETGNFYGLLNGVEQWGDYAPAIKRWELLLGRPAPAPTQTSSKGNPQLSAAFVEWLMGLPAGHVTGVPGITRNEALKALGNGVVSQQAEAALRWLLSRMEVAA